jgi:hypothetical protein
VYLDTGQVLSQAIVEIYGILAVGSVFSRDVISRNLSLNSEELQVDGHAYNLFGLDIVELGFNTSQNFVQLNTNFELH